MCSPTPTDKPKAVVTGIAAPKPLEDAADFESEWTVEQLKSGKPIMVYYFVPVDPKDRDQLKACEDEYKFAQKAETQAFSGKTVDTINNNWVPKKVEIDPAADRKVEQNQARVEFWSFTGKKLEVITPKTSQFLGGGEFDRHLKALEKKNREICNLEIKRINDEIERRRKADGAAAAVK